MEREAHEIMGETVVVKSFGGDVAPAILATLSPDGQIASGTLFPCQAFGDAAQRFSGFTYDRELSKPATWRWRK